MKNHILCALASLTIAGGAFFIGTRYNNNPSLDVLNSQHCDLRTEMRKLWSDHAWWSRNYLIAELADAPDFKATTDRLLKNQDDIGAAMVPYYGKEAGEKLASLLRKHIIIAGEITAASKENNDEKLKDSKGQCHANADAIAEFLSSINPNWPKDLMEKMMHEHLKFTFEETTARLNQDWEGDIKAFEKIFEEMMVMADALTSGIIKQFPEKF